ncbi:MAG: periplasmic protein TonB [Thermoanaerobaculia bacterium]|nr:periplasmic protein TonB [Thermoanaerobaculia bacterium]
MDFDNAEQLRPSDTAYPPSPAPTITAALYESRGRSHVLVAQMELNREDAANRLFVSDSGRYVVAFHNVWIACSAPPTSESRLLAVYKIGQPQVAAWTAGDFLNPYDVVQLSGKPVEVELRSESDEREIAALRIRAPDISDQTRIEERRVDLATTSLLDPKRDIYPAPHVFAAIADQGRHVEGPARDCSAAVSPTRIPSRELFSRAVRGPLPEFPIVAYKSHVRGTVTLELLISERGDVLCVRSTNLPFGLTAAAEEAARRWKFRPYFVDGRPVPLVGEIAFHFEDVDAADWKRIERGLPSTK